MNRQPVRSSDLQSVGYDADQQVLEIAFHRGGIYQYYSVPASVYSALMSASSHGQYFHTYIKDRYRYRKIR
jgi:hypothetical protein